MKILTVLGTRPEAIKMYPIIKELKSRNTSSKICISAQHKELLYSVLREFSIKADYDLGIYKKYKSLSEITCGVIMGITNILRRECPDIVLVHGDTTTAFSAATAAYYQKIPIAHIEAGLRTYDTENPFPEEFNRRGIDSISNLLFAPTETAVQNLISEHVEKKRIYLTGNTIYDIPKLLYKKDYTNSILDCSADTKLILLTTHRRENIPHLRSIYRAVIRLCSFEKVKVIFPIHPNPKIQKVAKEAFYNNDSIILTEPLKTVDFHNILARSNMVLTDSGGVQEEAMYYCKPTLILRNATERIEAVNSEYIKLVGTDENNIYNIAREFLNKKATCIKTNVNRNIFKHGAAKRIADIILSQAVN